MKEEIKYSKQSNIKSFAIYGLFGTKDVFIPFDNSSKILIGENGSGKTSILNALYYTITGKFNKLNTIVFNKLALEFRSGSRIDINKDDLMFIQEEDKYSGVLEARIGKSFNEMLTEDEQLFVAENLKKNNIKAADRLLSSLYQSLRYPPSVIRNTLVSMSGGRFAKLQELKVILKKEIHEEVLYFPTYRRIEEELQNLGTGKIELDKDDKRLIQFGMGDVSETFNKVILNIKNSAIEGFSTITGEMLSQYVDGLHEIDKTDKERIQPDILKIILERVGENIEPEYKERIIKLVNSNELFVQEDKYKYLINFLSNLIKIYDQQKALDNSIKNFANVCNGYLKGKNVIYNESKVSINVVQIKNIQEIDLKNLSSGEKQIISLFAKIFLEPSKELIVLFDEPELSLSIEWQKKLLPDVLKSNKCNLLLTVTHSPFIFDNELDMNAEDISKYISDI